MLKDMFVRCTTCKHSQVGELDGTIGIICTVPIPKWAELLPPRKGLISENLLTDYGRDCKAYEAGFHSLYLLEGKLFKWKDYQKPVAGDLYISADGTTIFAVNEGSSSPQDHRIIVERIA